MGVDQVDPFTATLLDEPAFLVSPVDSNTSCLREGCTELQPWAPNFAHIRADVLQGYSEASQSYILFPVSTNDHE